MLKRLCYLMLLFTVALTLKAAPGDIVSASIETNGWTMDVWISGVQTNGTFAFGLSGTTNAVEGNQKIELQVTSMGFDDSGNAITTNRVMYGTAALRFAYPNHAYKDTTIDGDNIKVKVILSDYVFLKDSNVVAAIKGGFYTSGATPNNATTSLTVTNGSILNYPKTIANWSWPGFDRITNSTFNLRCEAYHSSGQQGRPVRCVKFWSVDQSGNAVTNIVTQPTIDDAIGDALPVIEYIGTLSSSVLTQNHVITNNFRAYPWIGDSDSVLDTSDGAYTQPTPLYAPIYSVCDKNGTYGVTYAVVDSVSGSDSTGIASTSIEGANAKPCLTIGKAATLIAATNNVLYSRNDAGAGYILLKEGLHAWTGSAPSGGGTTEPKTWTTVTKYPGTTTANVIITNQAGAKDINDKVHISDVFIKWGGGGTKIYFDGIKYIWLDKDVIDCNGSAVFYDDLIKYSTHIVISNATATIGLLRPYSTINSSSAICRGCISYSSLYCMPYVFLGNIFYTNTIAFQQAYTGMTAPVSTLPIIAFNHYQFTDSGSIASWYLNSSPKGCVFAQNIVEKLGSYSDMVFGVASDGTGNQPVNNVLLWHNIILGGVSGRANLAYNDDADTFSLRTQWSIKNNIFDDFNIKSDTFYNPTYGYGPNRIGNWSVVNGVSCSGNLFAEVTDRAGAAPANFPLEFGGLQSINNTTSQASNYVHFVANGSYSGPAGTVGDYHLDTNSPAINLASSFVLPYDIAGTARYSGGAAGAYEYGSAPTTETNLMPKWKQYDRRTLRLPDNSIIIYR